MDVCRRSQKACGERQRSHVNGRTGQFPNEVVDPFHLSFSFSLSESARLDVAAASLLNAQDSKNGDQIRGGGPFWRLTFLEGPDQTAQGSQFRNGLQ
jgi:hypothetical protein